MPDPTDPIPPADPRWKAILKKYGPWVALAVVLTVANAVIVRNGGQPVPVPAPPAKPEPVAPCPPCPPCPTPAPGPAPRPDPAPLPQVTGFVVVESPETAGTFRGQVLSSERVQAFVAAARLDHSIVSTNAQGEVDNLRPYIERAKGKPLPYLFLVGGSAVVKELACPTDPDKFVESFDLAPHQRSMGNRPPPGGKLKYAWKEFGAAPQAEPQPTQKLIPRDQWKPVSLKAYLPAVKDQDGTNACNAFATVNAVEASRALTGMSYVRLSPGYLYGGINGGRDQGSYLEDGLAWMVDHGTCTAATVPDLAWRSRPAGAAGEAKSYRVVEAYLCPTVAHVASALQQGYLVVVGIDWFNSYMRPGPDGWLPKPDFPVGGHAICVYGLAQKGGVWGFRFRNTWGPTWGNGGDGVIPETAFGGGVGGYWAIRSVTWTREKFPPAPAPKLGSADELRKALVRGEFVDTTRLKSDPIGDPFDPARADLVLKP